MRKTCGNHSIPRSTLHRLTLDSFVLKGNLLSDPTERDIHVYVPAGHDGKGLPLLVDLVGFTGGGPGHTNWKNLAVIRSVERRGSIELAKRLLQVSGQIFRYAGGLLSSCS